MRAEILGATDPSQVSAVYVDFKPDLILIDLQLPEVDGFEALRGLKARIPADAFVPWWRWPGRREQRAV